MVKRYIKLALRIILFCILGDDSSSCEFSIALLCKNENEEWVKQQIKKKMLPLVTSSSSRYKVLIDRVTTQLGLYDYFMEIQNLLDSSLSEQAG